MFVLSFRLCIVLLNAFMAYGFIKYDIAEICGLTVSMNDDDIHGVEAVMYMTSQLSGTGSCNLTLEKRSDYDYLHFYFSTLDLPVCDEMSLYINEGNTLNSTMPNDDIPRLCGPMATGVVGDHYSSSKRYLALQLTWNPATTFRGTVFRLVANSYTCDATCGSGNDKCDDGPCISSNLDVTSGRDFCGGSLSCTTAKPAGNVDDAEEDTVDLVEIIGVIFVFIFCVVFKMFCCERCDCSCWRAFKSCCERTGHGLANCCGRIKDSWDDFSCPTCLETNPDSNISVGGEATGDTNAQPASCTTTGSTRYQHSASQTPRADTSADPPSYDAVVCNPGFAPPPNYDTVMSSDTF